MELRDLDFTFTYLEFDGATYLAANVVKASFFSSVLAGGTVNISTVLETEVSL